MAQASKALAHRTSTVTLATALSMAAIGAYAGLSGMVSMFTPAFLPIGLGLEVAKLVAASQLHRSRSAALQIALGALVVAAMVMSIAGMAGYISRHYVDHLHAAMAEVDGRSAGAREHVEALARRVAEDERQVKVIDDAANSTAARGRKAKATATEAWSARRAELARQLADDTAQFERAKVAAAEAGGDRDHALAEVQTVRYLARLVGLGDDVETAVSALSLAIAGMWDPFAVLLLVVATTSGQAKQPRARRRTTKTRPRKAPVAPVLRAVKIT